MSPIVSNKNFLGGKLRLRGTRMPIDIIAWYIGNGKGVEEIRKEYPKLTLKQIKAAIDYVDKNIHKEKSKLELKTT